MANRGERPREVKVCIESRRGALDGTVEAAISSKECSLFFCAGSEVGLEENSDETISRGRVFDVSVFNFCLFRGLELLGTELSFVAAMALAVLRTALLPVVEEGSIRGFFRRCSAIFFAVNLSFQRPPRKIACDSNIPASPIAKFTKSPSSAMLVSYLRCTYNRFVTFCKVIGGPLCGICEPKRRTEDIDRRVQSSNSGRYVFVLYKNLSTHES